MEPSAARPSDETLAQGMLDGDPAASEALVARYARPVYTLCYRWLGNPEDARDAVQDTFLRVVKYGRRFDPTRRFGPWLFGIAANACRTLLARRPASAADVEEVEPEDEAPLPPIAAEREEDVKALGRAIQALPERYRLLLAYRFQQGLSSNEIAGLLGIPPEQFGINLFRALNRLRSQFGRRP